MNSKVSPWDFADQAFKPAEQAKTPALNTQQEMADLTPLRGKAVLVVDTALATRRTLQEQLSQLGAKSIICVSSVADVENQLAERDFALILCEYNLEGDRNGQQLLEELRLNKRLPWSTSFMMVTGERAYSNVVSVAEFEPDDYLIKPFTASSLSNRIIRIFKRKLRLAEAYKAMYEGEFERVPATCIKLDKAYPQYQNELQRLRIESIFRADNLEQAETELKEAISVEPKPWMKLFLARIRISKKQFEESEKLLKHLVTNNPEYLMATDLYADVLWEQDKPEEALEALEKLGSRAVGSVTRLRKLADLSVRIGDDSKSKEYLSKVIERSRNSSLTQMHDYMALAKIYTKEGRHEDAEKLTSRLRKSVNSNELEFARMILAIQKDLSEENCQRAIEKLSKVFENQSELIEKLAADAQTTLLEQCFAVGMEQQAYGLARTISKAQPSKAILDRIKNSISKHNQKKKDEAA